MLRNATAFDDAPDQVEPDEPAPRKLLALNIYEFLSREIPPREMLLAPILPTQGLVMLYSWRGVGKTHTAIGIALAVASGGGFLRWKAPVPRRVLYLDGEMPAGVMQERIAAAAHASSTEPPMPDHLRIITPDLQPEGMPNLASAEGREAVEEWLADGCDLLVIDQHLDALPHGARERVRELGADADLASRSAAAWHLGSARAPCRKGRRATGNKPTRRHPRYGSEPEASG